MNRKATKSLTIVVAILILMIVLPVLVSYSGFKRDMQAAHDRVSGDSKILRTDKYTIEYSVKGDGIPVLLLHGYRNVKQRGYIRNSQRMIITSGLAI